MTEDEMNEFVANYNRILASESYSVRAMINLIEHLSSTGMKMRDIYAIADRPLKAKAAA